MLAPYNFKESKFVKTAAANHAEQGCIIGAKMILTKRITVDFNKKQNMRQDIREGTEVSIKGFEGDDKIVANFEAVFNKRTYHADVAIKISNLKFPNSTASTDTTTQWHAKYPFLNGAADQNLVLMEDWDTRQTCHDADHKSDYVKAKIKFITESIASGVPTYGPGDLMIVKRNSDFEVWTLKVFKPGELVFLPESGEVKSRFYTVNRSVVVRNTTDPSYKKGDRPYCIDGRVRGNPSPDSKSRFSLFWVVQRVPTGTTHINMVLKRVTCSIQASISFDGEDIPCNWPAESLPIVPVMTNAEKINKHTRLMIEEDGEVRELDQSQRKESLRQADEDKNESEIPSCMGHPETTSCKGHKGTSRVALKRGRSTGSRDRVTGNAKVEVKKRATGSSGARQTSQGKQKAKSSNR